jgi:23S rRNA pseudouridine2605 synthase
MVRHFKDTDKTPRPGQAEKRFGGPGGKKSPSHSGKRDDSKSSFSKGPGRPGGKPGGKDDRDAPKAPLRQERIAKVMARAGIASRREVERLIGLGKVAVNGRLLDTPATLVTRDDVITVDGKPIGTIAATRVWRYHKPVGLLTTHNDPAGRPTVFDAMPAGLPRVISVGRLDINTEGLLLLTNDGELARALELPTSSLVRQYRARARGRVTQDQLDKLKDGVTVDGERYGPIEATLDKVKEKAADTDSRAPANLWISVSITEGKNREVRKVLESVGLTVNRLIRLAYGPFQLGTLDTGHVEEVGPRVIREMLAQYIRPENLPQGNTVETPAPVPGRRPAGSVVRGKSGSPMSDPSRKPSRTRAAEAAVEEAEKRPAKKEGWAKAKPRSSPGGDRPKRPFKPREERADGERPRRDFKPREDRTPRADGDRPKRDFKPRDGGADRPRGGKPAGKPGGRPFAPRSAGPRSGGDRPGGDRPSGGGGKPRGPGGPRGRS